MRHRWTDEDRAFVAAQWASGIKQKHIAEIFGYAAPAMISNEIQTFLRKYADTPVRPDDHRQSHNRVKAQGEPRRLLVKDAISTFIAKRCA